MYAQSSSSQMRPGAQKALIDSLSCGPRRSKRAPMPAGSLVRPPSTSSRTFHSLGLRRTATESLRNELGTDGPAGASGPAQLAREAFPVGLGPQGVLLELGLPAIRISGSGETDPPASDTAEDDVDVNRFGELGRGVIRTVAALANRRFRSGYP